MYKRSEQGERNRLASIPKGKDHWNFSKNPTIKAIHRWVNRWYGRANKCVSPTHNINSNVKKYDWALIKGKKYAKKISNFMMLCRSCHTKYDYTEARRKRTSEIMKERQSRK